ncbi:MAG: NADH-quinone oxidoreductase subunit NuoK [bacterium]|nr:NADH-quinone oxidoreductase subunit NuoK [bacterium]
MIHGNLILAMAIFTIGMLGILWKRNAIAIFMCVELMLNAANLVFVTFAQSLGQARGVAVFLFVITVAAAEAAVGLALFIKVFNDKQTIEADRLDMLQH